MKRWTAAVATLATSAATMLGGFVGASAAIAAPPAPTPAANTCTGIRYASTSNTIYLEGPRAYTLSSMVANCARLPLVQTDSANKTWLLSADLVVGAGATLNLGGDVNTLRLRSRSSNVKTEVSALTVRGGTLNANGVTVTSWDDRAGAVDTTPANVGAGQRGRAFVRAQSYADASGTHKGTMNITNSTFTNLGYYAPESYGVSYKTLYCGRANPAACGANAVTGRQTNSTFSNNYMGTYYWGARNMRFVGNKYVNNVMYGLNGHDGVNNITIERNVASNNGNHGIICSQSCSYISIRGNRVEGNGKRPWTGPNPDASGPPMQVHGIMLHRGTKNAIISGNVVNNHRNGAGVAIFDNAGASVSGNRIDGAKYGIRVSVGSVNNTFTGNTVSNSTDYGVFSYSGSDTPQYTTRSGRPTGNVFSGNTFTNAGVSTFKLNDSDRFTFSNNTVTGAMKPVEIARGAGHRFTSNTFPAQQRFILRGTAAQRTTVAIAPSKGVVVDRDSFSAATLR